MRPETDLAISECMRFFSCLHCHRTDPICVTYEQKKKNWNWVTFKAAFYTAGLDDQFRFCDYIRFVLDDVLTFLLKVTSTYVCILHCTW